MKKLRVTIEGRAFEVLVEVLDQHAAFAAAPVAALSATPAIAEAPAPTQTAPAPAADAPKVNGAAEANTVMSTLAGKIVSIDVKVGQSVGDGEQVATIEAMKMNTYIYAAKAGRVQAVLVNAGDAVDEGAALVTLA